MKNTILVLALVTFVFISCKKNNSLIQSNGIIRVQGITSYQYGTHKIIDVNGKILFALRSDKINLDDYLDKQVEIEGREIENYPLEGGPEFLEVTKIK